MVNEIALDTELPNALNALYGPPDVDWTLGVKTALCEVSQRIFPVEANQHIKTYASGVGSAGPEWLFDVTCLVEDADICKNTGELS